MREGLRNQLDQFFNLLEEAVETGDPAWLDSVIEIWATSLTQTDLEGGTSNLTRLMGELMVHTHEVCRETLDEAQGQTLMGALLPCFSHAFEKAAQAENQVKMAFLSNELADVRQSLEKLDRSKSDFISVAAHELRTPLTLIEGYAAMLEESLEQEAAKGTEAQLIRGIHHGTRRLHSIIDDMIDVSLIDNNMLTLNHQPVWVNRLLAVLSEEVRSTLSDRNLSLNLADFEGSNEMIFGDPERLLQLLRNVLTNAIKFTPDGGQIWIDGRKLPGFLEITIHDSGIGIDQEDQSTIFDKFSRLGDPSLHSSGKTKFKGGGPGLGLHIAKGIVEAHNGAIWVDSPGYDEKKFPGSTFHILLPIQQEPPDEKMARIFSSLHTTSSSERKTQPYETF
ncbi:histidine kinase [Longilinea arvoryzae]|uniref:histidine kinase n=1 Tax=Longilinea arvoryzae TaxID=360412 RepID=A0A0S7BJQ7_9CHLR|nr:histidine kinase [Longilinea arvoryzae]